MRKSTLACLRLFALTAAATRLAAQAAPDIGVLAIVRGADTLVTDRFVRQADTLRGTIQVVGQPRIDYLALLGPNETVQSFSISMYLPGASTNAEPAQRVKLIVQGDSVVAETPAGVHRLASKPGAIPMINNALAMTELFTRRAKLSGGAVMIPYFAVNGGATVDVVVSPVGADSQTVVIGPQMQRFHVDPSGRILGGTIPGTGMEFRRIAGSAPPPGRGFAGAIAPPRDYTAPPGAPYTAEEVRLRGPGGLVLGGTLTKPANARGRLPAVVTITGSGQQDRDEYIPFAGGIRLFRQIADTLSRRGIAVLRLDDRGIGDSGGDPATSTSADFADDVRAAVAWLRSRPDIDGARIALVGHSEGGAIAPMVAATDPALRAIVVMAGPGEPPIEISMAQNRFIVERDTTLTPAMRDSILRVARASLDPSKLTEPWVKTWMAYDPAADARRVKAPTLILQGATDRQVPVDQAEKLARLIRAGGNRDVTVRIFPSTNHLFVDDPNGDFNEYPRLRTNRVGANVLGPLADWLAAKLSARTDR